MAAILLRTQWVPGTWSSWDKLDPANGLAVFFLCLLKSGFDIFTAWHDTRDRLIISAYARFAVYLIISSQPLGQPCDVPNVRKVNLKNIENTRGESDKKTLYNHHQIKHCAYSIRYTEHKFIHVYVGWHT